MDEDPERQNFNDKKKLGNRSDFDLARKVLRVYSVED